MSTQTYSLSAVSFSAAYTNARKTSGGNATVYDAAGSVTSSDNSSTQEDMDWKFDAAGRQKRWEEFGPYGLDTYKGEQLYYDVDGRDAKRGDLTKTRVAGVWGSWNEVPSYKLYSSVTGKEVQSLTSNGSHYRTHVYVDEMRIADERNGTVWFNSTDPISGSTREVDEDGVIFSGDEEETRTELAALGTAVPNIQVFSSPTPTYPSGGAASKAEGGCVIRVDGQPRLCNEASHLLSTHAADVDEDNSDPFELGHMGISRVPVYGYKVINHPDQKPDPRNPEDTVVTIKTEEEKYFIGWDYHINGISMPPQQHTPCELMAQRAQKVANEVISSTIKNNPPSTPTYVTALPYFDFNFNTWYIGHIVDGSYAATKYFNWDTKGGINNSSPSELGQQDFKSQYLDDDYGRNSTAKAADQVHHFAFYFSAGINDAALSAAGGNYSDSDDLIFGRGPSKGANKGDQNLAQAAYKLGQALRKHPSDLSKIGEIIRNEICN